MMMEPAHMHFANKTSQIESSLTRARGQALDLCEAKAILDEEIWKRLSEDLQEAVIARLPISAIFRFRLVCRKWNSLLDSPSFLQRQADFAQNQQPWLFVKSIKKNRNMAMMYDPCMKKWHLSNNWTVSLSRDFCVQASAGGWICGVDYSNMSVHVANPLTQTWKELPKTPHSLFSPYIPLVLGVILNQDLASRGYQIVWMDRRGKYEVYDSLKNSWVAAGTIPLDVKHPMCFPSQAVSIGAVVYFRILEPQGIMSYDVMSGAWEKILIPDPPNSTPHRDNFSLAECEGQILLVGQDSDASVCVWELEKASLVWNEVDRMPHLWCLELSTKGLDLFSCLGNRRLLVILMRSPRSSRSQLIFTYDVVSREWSKVDNQIGHRIHGGSLFFPQLFVSP